MKIVNVVLARLGVSILAIGLLLVLLEIALRTLGLGRPVLLDATYDRSHAYYYPDAARTHPWSRGTTNVLKVAVIGDSITNGAGVPYDDRYGNRLERLLNMNPDVRPAEVRVYARGGAATYMQRPFFQEALAWGAELVILGICLNDTQDWTVPEKMTAMRNDRVPRVPAPWLATIFRASRVLDWAYRKAESARCNRATMDAYRELYDPDYSGWRKFAGSIRGFRQFCNDNRATLVAAVFPRLGNLHAYEFDFVHARIRALLEAEGVHSIDLLGSLRGKSPVRLQAIPGIDGHPSEIAHRIAAEAIFRFLLDAGHLDPVYEPVRREWSPREPWEELARKMRDPLRAPEQ
jgi:hypothetical protein